jgi:hypothetical protein
MKVVHTHTKPLSYAVIFELDYAFVWVRFQESISYGGI